MRISPRHPIEQFLRDVGRLERQKLGPSVKPRPAVSRQRTAALEQALAQTRATQHRLLALCVVLLCVLFATQLGLLLFSVGADRPLIGLVGGGSLAFWPLLWLLRRLWIESSLIDVARSVLVDLPAEESVKVIEILYRNLLLPRSPRQVGGRADLSP